MDMDVRVIGQIGGTVDVSALGGGAAWERWALEQSWVTAGVLAVVCAMGAFVALRAGKSRMAGAVMVVGFVVAVGIAAAGVMVETVRERLVRQTREFVAAVAEGRTAEVAAMVEERVTLRSGGKGVDGDRSLVVGVSAALPGVIRDYSVRMRGAEVRGANVARSRMTVRVAADGMVVGEAYSSWDLSWRRDDSGAWRIAGIECLSVFGREPGSAWVTVARRLARGGSGE